MTEQSQPVIAFPEAPPRVLLDHPQQGLAPGIASGYVGFALGPPRDAVPSGAGWLFGAGAQYGLGVHVGMENHRRKIDHGGAVNGFVAANTVYPDDRTAMTVLVSLDASPAPGQLSGKLAEILLEQAQPADIARTTQARSIFEDLQHGRLDRGLFTANANFYFTDQAIADFKTSLAPLGAPKNFRQTRRWLRGGMTGRSYDAKFADRRLRVWTYEMPDGKLEQFQVAVND